MIHVKTELCHILAHFEVAPCKDTPVRVVTDTNPFERTDTAVPQTGTTVKPHSFSHVALTRN